MDLAVSITQIVLVVLLARHVTVAHYSEVLLLPVLSKRIKHINLLKEIYISLNANLLAPNFACSLSG